jgi:hypothetical protein
VDSSLNVPDWLAGLPVPPNYLEDCRREAAAVALAGEHEYAAERVRDAERALRAATSAEAVDHDEAERHALHVLLRRTVRDALPPVPLVSSEHHLTCCGA